MKQSLPKKIAVLSAAIIIMAVIIAATIFVWTSRPVVEYSISGYAYSQGIYTFNPYGPFYTTTLPDTYTLVNSNTPLMVALHWENKGNIDTSLQLALTTKNANITWFSNFGSDNVTAPVWASEADGQTYNGTTVTFLTQTKANSTMQTKYLNIFPVGNPQNFTITYSLTDTSSIFSSLSPVGETTATYELTSENVYQLLK